MKKEIAEARQAGTMAPELDVESGKMINPHNPDFITKRPWYLGDSGPSLQHHDTRGAATASEVSMAEADAHLRRRRGAWEGGERGRGDSGSRLFCERRGAGAMAATGGTAAAAGASS